MSLTISQPLKRRVLEAAVWSMGGYAIALTLRFGSNLLMTRLLAPEMFGVLAIAWAVLTGLAMFSDVGVRQSVVQSPRGHDPSFLNTVWTIQVIRGLVMFAVAVGISLMLAGLDRVGILPASSVYSDPDLPYVLGAVSLTTLISGFTSTKTVEASRAIQLRKVTRNELLAQSLGLACMLAFALFNRSIWVLVVGSLASSIGGTILSHATLPGTRNRLHWDRSAVSEVTHFGRWILVSSILGFFVNNGDRLLLGGLVDARHLGIYSIAALLVGSVEGALQKIMSDVSFPAMSEIARASPQRLRDTYYRLFTVVAAIAYSLSGLLISLSISLVSILYDSRYQSAGWMLQLLAFTLVAMPSRLISELYLAQGISRVLSNTIVVRLIVLATIVPAGFAVAGLWGALLGIALSRIAGVPVALWYSLRHRIFDLKKELALLLFLPAGFLAGELVTLAARSLLR